MEFAVLPLKIGQFPQDQFFRGRAMDRQQREAELKGLLTTQRGKEEILAILKEHAGIHDGANLPPFGTLLVDTILNYEFPPEKEPPAQLPPAEPGDEKFEDPPGQEALGG
jgi:hypothetical protein